MGGIAAPSPARLPAATVALVGLDRTVRPRSGPAGRDPGRPTSAGWAWDRWRPACWPTSAPRSSRSRTASASTRPRRLPIYKDEPARNFGEERLDADPNKGGLFNNYSRNKLGVTINMRTPEGRDVAERLIARSSVVSENFAPGVMERWGLTYERLRELRPDVIYARMSGYGHSGPHAEYRSYGPVVQAVSGLSFISGLPGREPSGWGLSYMDNQAAFYNSAALLMAIYRRGITGEGTEIDVSAVEAGINLVGPILLDVSVNGHSAVRPDFPTGNRLEWPQRRAARRVPVAGRRPVGRDRGLRRRPVGPVRQPPSAAPDWDERRPLRHPGRPARQPGRPRRARRRVDPDRDRHEVTELLQGRRRAGGRGAERRGPQRDAIRRSPPAACSSRWITR